MSKVQLTAVAAIGLIGALTTSPARAQSADAEIAALKQQLRLMEQKVDKVMEGWNYALIYDFGGASDGFASTASAGGVPVGFLPGGAVSGIENAYLSYTGFKPFGGKLAIEGGVMDLPYTLDEATSSNDVLFMERAAAGIAATNIAAGDFRSTVGARWYTDTFWAGAYVTGPTTGLFT